MTELDHDLFLIYLQLPQPAATKLRRIIYGEIGALQASLAEKEKSRDSWQEEARLMTVNRDYWKARFEDVQDTLTKQTREAERLKEAMLDAIRLLQPTEPGAALLLNALCERDDQ